MSPVLAGRVFTTETLGEPLEFILFYFFCFFGFFLIYFNMKIQVYLISEQLIVCSGPLVKYLLLFLFFCVRAKKKPCLASLGDSRDGRFDPWLGKITWRRAWQPAPVFLPGEYHGQGSLVGYILWGHKESDMTQHTHTSNFMYHLSYVDFILVTCKMTFTFNNYI